MTVAALLLAAGAARRYGRAKQLLDIDGEPLVRRCARAVLATGCPLTVMLGAHADAVGAALADLPATLQACDGWNDGMGHVLAAGVRSLAAQRVKAILVCLADQPDVDTATLRALLKAHAAAPAAVVIADYNGTLRGPPCIWPAATFPLLTSLRGDQGARAVLRDYAGAVIGVALPQAMTDIDTPADFTRWRARGS